MLSVILQILIVQVRGVMPIQSEGAAPSDFLAKWILNAASKSN